MTAPRTSSPTASYCTKKHAPLWGAVMVLLLTMALFILIVNWSWTRADLAIEKAGAAEAAAKENRTEMTTSFSFIRDGLRRIDEKLDKLSEKP